VLLTNISFSSSDDVAVITKSNCKIRPELSKGVTGQYLMTGDDSFFYKGEFKMVQKTSIGR
jgi:hypothetical protein